jgi:hypothetical protein
MWPAERWSCSVMDGSGEDGPRSKVTWSIGGSMVDAGSGMNLGVKCEWL